MTSANPAEKKKVSKPPKGCLNLSQIEMRTGVYRQTAKKRMESAGILPHPDSTEKEKFYKWDAVTEALVLKSENAYTEARIDRTSVQTERDRLKLEQEKGELIPRRDVVHDTSLLFGTLHKKIAVQGIKDLVKGIRKAKTAADAEAFARGILNQPFMDAREDYPKFLEDNAE